MNFRLFRGFLLVGIFVALRGTGIASDIPESASYRLWFEDKYGAQKMFVCLSGLVQYDGSLVVRSALSDDAKVISWRLNSYSHFGGGDGEVAGGERAKKARKLMG